MDIVNEMTPEEKQSLSQLSGTEGRKKQGKYGVICYTAEELVNMQLPPVKFIVDDLLPEGLTVLAGAPKIGKSWFMMGLCVAVSSGGLFLDKIKVKPATCLYLALEDNERRLSTRLKLVLRGKETPANLHISPAWPRIDQGGADLLAKFIEKHQDAKLVVIDTLAKIRPRAGNRNKTLYDIDYEAMEPLKAVADRFGIAIVIVHHTRKSGADDKFDEISGTTGLTGGTDGMMVLKKDRAQCDAVLFVSGRDVMDKEIALKWNADSTSWSIMGSAEEYRM